MSSSPQSLEPGAPVPAGQIDLELVKLGRSPMEFGVVTTVLMVLLCGYFLVRLYPDWRYARHADTPHELASLTTPTLPNTLVAAQGQPMVAQAARVVKRQGYDGVRVALLAGSQFRYAVLVAGGAETPVHDGAYVGRARALGDIPAGRAALAYWQATPQWVFTDVAAVGKALTGGRLTTVTGDEIAPAASDLVRYELRNPSAVELRLPLAGQYATAEAWSKALAPLMLLGKLTPDGGATPRLSLRVDGVTPAEARTRLTQAGLFAAIALPVVTRHESTWGALRMTPSGQVQVGAVELAAVEVATFAVATTLPVSAATQVIMEGELPSRYWYVSPLWWSLWVAACLFGLLALRALRRARSLWQAGTQLA